MATIVRMHDRRCKSQPTPIHIQKGASQPSNQDSPSFLTTLPPEIRNEVYKWLLVREEPIIYDGCRSDRERGPCFDFDYSESDDGRELTEEELSTIRKPSHDIGPCLPLLRSCRQIYFEAVGILYGANSFLVSANPYQHNKTMTQIYTAANFLTSLGSQLHLLKELTIDITPLCPEDCAGTSRFSVDAEQIDVLPIVRILWFQPKVAQIVSLASTGRNLDKRVHPYHTRAQSVHNIQPLLLHGVIRSLGSKNSLGIMQYGRFERLLSRVWVRRNLDWGWTVHPIPSRNSNAWRQEDAEVVQPFDIFPSRRPRSAKLKWGSWTYDSKLHMFPQSIEDQIRSYAIESGDNILFDLERQSAHGLDFGILQLDRRFRSSMQQNVANRSQITVSFATSEVRTDFSNYASLRRWLEHPISKVYPKTDMYKASWKIPPRMALEFEIRRPVSPNLGLAGLRVNVTSFIRLTYDLLPQSMVVIRIKTNEGGIKDEYAISLATLRQRCFVFISELMVNRSAQSYQPCPELWIDGYGTVLEAGGSSNDASQHGGYYSNSYAKLDDTDLLEIGREYATNLERRPAPMLPAISYTESSEDKSPNAVRLQRWKFQGCRKSNQALRECDDLCSMWISLKDLDWPDEQGHDAWGYLW